MKTQLSLVSEYLYNIISFHEEARPACTQISKKFNNISDLSGGTIKVINSLGQQVATTHITATGTNSTMSLNI